MTVLRGGAVAVVLALGTATVGVNAIAPTSNAAAARGRTHFHASHGISVVSARHPSARLWRLVVHTRKLQQSVHVNVLLPVGYQATGRPYPVL